MELRWLSQVNKTEIKLDTASRGLDQVWGKSPALFHENVLAPYFVPKVYSFMTKLGPVVHYSACCAVSAKWVYNPHPLYGTLFPSSGGWAKIYIERDEVAIC